MTGDKIPTPKPKTAKRTCTVCGLDWERHGKAPTVAKCVELPKADLAARKQSVEVVGTTYPLTNAAFCPFHVKGGTAARY